MSCATFTIPGTPFAKQRPRFGRGRAFTPRETVSFERTVGTLARPHFPEPMEGPVKVTIWATFAVPVSWPLRRRREALHNAHMQRPDLDNIAKAVCDGLNRIAFVDDKQIAELHVRKVWGETPRTVVSVEGMA